MSELIDNIKGVDLKTYISNADNKAKLKDTNLFYVISTSAEPDVFKIGVAFGSEHSPFKALDRLNSYYLHHGRNVQDSKNKCVGARIHYLMVTKHNKNIHYSATKVWKLELRMKRELKKRGKIARGDERTNVSYGYLRRLMNQEELEDEPETQVKKRTQRAKLGTQYKEGQKVNVKYQNKVYTAIIKEIKSNRILVQYDVDKKTEYIDAEDLSSRLKN